MSYARIVKEPVPKDWKTSRLPIMEEYLRQWHLRKAVLQRLVATLEAVIETKQPGNRLPPSLD